MGTARLVGLVTAVLLLCSVVAGNRMSINGNYGDEFLFLLTALAFFVSLLVWAVAFTIAARCSRDEAGFEVVSPITRDGPTPRQSENDTAAR
jgi:hypothetical protein